MFLDQLIEMLEKQDPTVILPIGFDAPHSYRGNYMDVAFVRAANISVAECLAAAREALGSTYYGYKGGEYRMESFSTAYIVEGEDRVGTELTEFVFDLLLRLAAVEVPA